MFEVWTLDLEHDYNVMKLTLYTARPPRPAYQTYCLETKQLLDVWNPYYSKCLKSELLTSELFWNPNFCEFGFKTHVEKKCLKTQNIWVSEIHTISGFQTLTVAWVSDTCFNLICWCLFADCACDVILRWQGDHAKGGRVFGFDVHICKHQKRFWPNERVDQKTRSLKLYRKHYSRCPKPATKNRTRPKTRRAGIQSLYTFSLNLWKIALA